MAENLPADHRTLAQAAAHRLCEQLVSAGCTVTVFQGPSGRRSRWRTPRQRAVSGWLVRPLELSYWSYVLSTERELWKAHHAEGQLRLPFDFSRPPKELSVALLRTSTALSSRHDIAAVLEHAAEDYGIRR